MYCSGYDFEDVCGGVAFCRDWGRHVDEEGFLYIAVSGCEDGTVRCKRTL
jgi:hypothetical protein